MNSPSENSRREYAARIHRILDHIDRNLDRSLPLEDLARVAGFPPVHFHRIFKAQMGETLNRCVRRKRMERAAALLLRDPDRPEAEIAAAVGLPMPGDFDRAFEEHYGTTPALWRSGDGVEDLDEETGPVDFEELDALHAEPFRNPPDRGLATTRVKIREMPAHRVAFFRRFGPHGEGEVEVLETLRRWAGSRGLLKAETVILIIHHDDPTVTPVEGNRTDACVAVPADFRVEEPARDMEVPGGTFAVMPFRGTRDERVGAWSTMFAGWLPLSGYQPDDRPGYVRFPGDTEADAGTGTLFCEICLPVIPLQETEQAGDPV